MIVTEINKMALQCKNLTPVSCPVEAVQILLKSLEECNYDATRFFMLAVIFRTTLNKSHLGDSNNTCKKHLCVV